MAAQYYKINYKSDFVLTINSDAGWAVPFCIKFWTGMPSQAYFAGFDGENYVNCRVGETPTQLLVMFDDHHMPIGELKMQIAYHTTIEDFPDRQFDEVTNPTNVTVDIDGTEYQVMLDFTGESGAEIDFSMPSSGVMSVNGKIGYVTLNAEDVGAQPTIEDLATIRSGAAAGATAVQPAAMNTALAAKEDKSNKVTSFSSPTDTQYPSAKLVSDQLATKQGTISDLSTIRSGAAAGATAVQPAAMNTALAAKEDKSNKVTSFSSPTDTQYPSAKLVSDQLATKQGTISDLSTIRSGAAAGATAVQPAALQEGLAGKQDTISDLSTIRSGAAAGATAVQPAALQEGLAGKQDTISDLSTIRSGASAGATAVQPAALESGLAEKQDTISDLATIRSGAAAGATAVQPAAMNTALAAKQDMLTFDNAPTANSDNPVKSSGIKIALDAKQSTINTVNVTVDNNTGTPSGSASVSGSTLSLSFQNLKGATGATGATGPQGPQGERGPQGNTGVTVESVNSIIHSIDPTATYAAADVAGADAVQDIQAEVAELAGRESWTKTILHNNIDISTGVISVNLTWLAVGNQNYKHGIVQVEGCSKISFTATADHPITFAFLKSYNPVTGQSANLCDGTQLTGVSKGLSKEYNLPETCKFVYFRALDSGNNEDVPETITLTYPAVDGSVKELEEYTTEHITSLEGGLASAQASIQQNAADIAELEKAIEGEHEEDVMFVASTGGPLYATNNLEEGVTYKVKAIIGNANWVRIGFGTSNTTTASDPDYLSIFASLTLGEHEQEFVAPDPTTYPYIVYYKASVDNSAEIVKETITIGLEERMTDAEDEIDSILASQDVIIDVQQTVPFTANSVIDTRINPVLCDFKQGEDVYLDVHGYNIAYVVLMVREKGTSAFTAERLTQEDTTSIYLNAGDRHWFSASKNIDAIAFYAAASIVTESGTMSVRVRNQYGFFVNSQLNGKKILMFGDSNTQLPLTGSTTNGKGIVEYFADITGADVVRCAIGGTKLSRYAPVTQVTNATEASNAIQICSMVELSMTGQGNLLTAAAPYLSDNYAKTIPTALAAMDMNTVDAITVFGGTNDMTADVALNNGDELDTSTIEGAINTIVKSVHENYPHIKIFIFTPIVRYFVLNGETTDEAAFVNANWSDVYQNAINKRLYDYADEVINVARENHVPVCDLYRGMGWDKYSYVRYLFRKAVGKNIDGTHPRFGFDKIAQTMASFMAANW